MMLTILSLFSLTLMVKAGHRDKVHGHGRKGFRVSSRYHPRRLQEETPAQVEEFHLWEPHEFKDALDRWRNEYPDLIRVNTSQEAYGLPRAGGPSDCPFAEGDGCPNYMLTIQDFIAHPEGSSSSANLPEVFWSGCLHGDERVGPTSVMVATALLLEAAMCESKPNPGRQSQDKTSWQAELAEAKLCRQVLKDKGVDDLHRKWLARLVTTRRIIVVPTANALGYFRNNREENGVDPNRDFPYDMSDAASCFQTIAGRTLNEIFREHMFQLSLTFHGGMEVIGYEWGAPSWLNHFSPDDEAQNQIAAAYSRFGGGWSTSKPYQYGTMNDLVYYVRGGFEDWAYAGSFDGGHVPQCQPQTYGGYPKSKSIYGPSTLRVFNMLVETSNRKEPQKKELGTSLDILNRDTTGNGHVSRNARLSLLSAELVEPYVSIVGVNNLALSDDVVPLTYRGGRTCQVSKAVMIPANAKQVEIEWSVGGAIHIDDTKVIYAKWSDVPESELDCLSQPTALEGFLNGSAIGTNNGTSYFSSSGSHPRPDDSKTGSKPSFGPLFRASIAIPSGMKPHDQLVVVALARVDQSWKNQPENIAPGLPPQSHIVNARTNLNWKHESAGKYITGRLDWYSIPLTIVIGEYRDSIGTQGDLQVSTVELNSRFGDSTGISKGGMRPKSADKIQLRVSGWALLAIVLLILTVGFCLCFACRRGRRPKQGKTSELFAGDDDHFVFDSKPYSDAASGEDESDDEDDDEEGGVQFPTLA